jgi:hypothetical protein
VSQSRAPRRLVAALAASAIVVLTAALPASAAAPAASSTPAPAPSPSIPAPGTTGNDKNQATFGLGPSKNGVLDGRSGFTFLAPRGGRVSDQLVVVNLSYQPLTLNLYPADALNGTDGSLGIAARSAPPKDLAAWVRLKTPTGRLFVVVPARGKVAVPVTVSVPKNAFVGDHLAGIAASIVAKGQTPGDRGTNVAFEQRVAIRLALRVAGQLRPELTIKDVTASYAGTLNPFGKGSALVSYTVVNSGNARLQGHQEVKVQGLYGGTAIAPDLGDLPLLLPGASAHVTVEVPDVTPAVALTAAVTVVGEAPLGDATPPVQIATASTRLWAVPWTLVALVIGLLLVLGWFVRQRRRGRGPAPTGGRTRGDATTPSTRVPV